jgi:uncharacterized membrane protein (DUF4010 family)
VSSSLEGLLASTEWRLAVALGVGLLIGAERERRKEERGSSFAGVRTFALTALLGGIAWILGDGGAALLIAGAAFVGGTAIVAHLTDPARTGLTSEVALVLTYFLGALAQVRPGLALAIGVLSASILAFRATLHELVRRTLSERELLDALVLGVAALVVWPLLPNRALDPLGAINPSTLWRLVVTSMALGGAGHVATRIVGPRFGLALSGFASGFISSSATIHAFGKRAASEPRLLRSAVAGATASTVATFVQMAIFVGAASPALLRHAWLPLTAGGVAALLYAVVQAWRAARETTPEPSTGRAFELRAALIFAALVAALTFLSALVKRSVGARAVLVVAGVAAFADAHAAGSTMGSVYASDGIGDVLAVVGVLVSLSTNTITKIVLAFQGGPRRYGVHVLIGLLIVIAAAWGGFAIAMLTSTL